MLSYLKKFLVALVLVFLSAQPLSQIVLILLINLASFGVTLITHPFTYQLLNAVRLVTDVLGIMLLVMHIVFYNQEQKFRTQS